MSFCLSSLFRKKSLCCFSSLALFRSGPIEDSKGLNDECSARMEDEGEEEEEEKARRSRPRRSAEKNGVVVNGDDALVKGGSINPKSPTVLTSRFEE